MNFVILSVVKIKSTLLTFFLLILLATGVYAVFFLKRDKIPADEKVLTGAQEMMGMQGFRTTIAQAGEMWWAEEGDRAGRFVFNQYAFAFVTSIGLTDKEVEQYVTPQTVLVFEHPDLARIYALLDNYFEEEGFSQNSYNSLPIKVGLAWSDYVSAYELGGLKCTVTTHNEVATYTSDEEGTKSNVIEVITACEDDWKIAKDEQSKYIEDLGLEENGNVGVSLANRVGKMLDLVIYYHNSADAYKVIAEENGKLTVLYNSQTDGPTPSCTKMQGVPTTLYRTCR